jgi:hypothetical protein
MAARNPENLIPLGEYLRRNLPRRVFPPGQLAAYSNYGSALAAYVVEVVSGLPFEDYLERNIFDPLGMRHSTFRQPLPERLESLMSGGYKFQLGVFEPDDFELIRGMAPAGSMSTTAEDLARFMIAHLQSGRYGDGRILDESTARLMHTRLFSHDARLDGNAHGFWEWTYNGIRTIGHGGDTFLFHSMLILIPQHDTGFFVSYNSEGGGGGPRMELMEALFDRYFPANAPAPTGPPQDFSERAGRFTGLYMLSRVNFSTFIKVMQLFSTVRVRATKEGNLVIGSGSSARQYAAIEPLLFREVGGQKLLAFREDDEGRITDLFLGQAPYFAGIRMNWRERPAFHLFALAVTGLLLASCLVWPVGALRRRICRYSAVPTDAPARARLLAGAVSALCGVFLVGLIALFSRPESVIYGVPFALKVLLLIPFVAALLALGVLFYVFMSWLKGYWHACSRLHYLLILLAFAGFLWLLYHWNLLGFKY